MLARDGKILQNAPRILLVDDEDLLSWCIEMELSALGFDVKTASSLGLAREVLKDFDPDLVICDQGLPDGVGTDVIKQLQRPVPSIMITAFTPPRMEDLQAVGIQRLLRKPFDLDVLTAEVQKQLRTCPWPETNPFPPPHATWEG